jgi:Tfp pilus assembly protein PilV
MTTTGIVACALTRAASLSLRSARASRPAARQRGVTMISVLLLVLALLSLGVLAVRSSVRNVTQAGQLVARERALMAAQAAADLAASQVRGLADADMDALLAGRKGGECDDPCADCIPRADAGVYTGQRNAVVEQAITGRQFTDCGGRPCMRQGAVAFLNDAAGVAGLEWCNLSLRAVSPNADPEATVSVWIRNDLGDVMGADASPTAANPWLDDTNQSVVITVMATVRNATVAIEQTISITAETGRQVLQPQSPDEGYGGGHNNDNSAVSVCTEDFVAGTP